MVEQFDADGSWSGVDRQLQRGDGRLLRRWLDGGDREALAQLAAHQRRGNYTAWKYDYLDEMTDLLLTARAAALPLFGCDMPRPLQARLGAIREDLRDRLREIHCLAALRGQKTRTTPRRVAMVWGQSHVVGGLQMLLPPEVSVAVVLAYGHRASQLSAEAELARSGIALLEPVLVSGCPGSRPCDIGVLLLPGEQLAARVDRARDPVPQPVAPDGRCKVLVRSDQPATLLLGQRKLAVNARATTEAIVEAGSARLLLRGKRLVLWGQIELPPRGEVHLDLGPARRSLRVVYRPVR